MNVYELKLKLYLIKDLKQQETLNQVAVFIDEVLSKNDDLLTFHLKNCYKNYVFCSLYPTAISGIHKGDNIYSVIIRTIVPELAEYFFSNLSNHSNTYFKGLTCDIKKIPKRLIEKIYSITPILLKNPNGGYWKNNMNFEEFETRIKVNLIKKYNSFMNQKIDENFSLYSTIIFLNNIPIKIPYKEIHLLGDKIELMLNEHPIAQKLIYMSLGTGLCESNARGCGFINYKWYKEGRA